MSDFHMGGLSNWGDAYGDTNFSGSMGYGAPLGSTQPLSVDPYGEYGAEWFSKLTDVFAEGRERRQARRATRRAEGRGLFDLFKSNKARRLERLSEKHGQTFSSASDYRKFLRSRLGQATRVGQMTPDPDAPNQWQYQLNQDGSIGVFANRNGTWRKVRTVQAGSSMHTTIAAKAFPAGASGGAGGFLSQLGVDPTELASGVLSFLRPQAAEAMELEGDYGPGDLDLPTAPAGGLPKWVVPVAILGVVGIVILGATRGRRRAPTQARTGGPR